MSLSPKASEKFLSMCLGGRVADSEGLLSIDGEEDFWAAEDDAKQCEHGASQLGTTNVFALADTDDEDDSDDDAELEDAYNFDPDMVATLLKQKQCTVAELTEKFQESMAQVLERRLMAQICPDKGECNEDRPDCQGDVDGRMTPPEALPGCMTPPVKTTTTCTSPDAQVVAEKLEKAQQEAMARCARRSSAVKRDAIQEAMNKAVSMHRRSLTSKVSEKLEEGSLASAGEKINIAMQNTHKRHRLSLSKAAETLDAAGLDDQDNATVSSQLQMVHKAMEEARRRHRRSIADAVQKVTGISASAQPFEPVAGMSASAAPFQPNIQDRIQSAIASAHRRQHEEAQSPPGFQSFHSQPSRDGCLQSNTNCDSQHSWGQINGVWNDTQSHQFSSCEDQFHMQRASSYGQSGYGQHTHMQASCDSWQPESSYAQQGFSETFTQDCAWQGDARHASMYAQQGCGEQTSMQPCSWQSGAQPATMYAQQGCGEQTPMQDCSWQGGTQSYYDSFSGKRCCAEGGNDNYQGSYQNQGSFQQPADHSCLGKEAQWCQQDAHRQQLWSAEGSGCAQAWPAAWGSA
eukprot:TRINITY_DN3583_c0_g1_i1.p1 TRINITY_DN3583_c0_g1~~TRINITY_DN3583_c0_g1_i1.p1  ORF type:complete len:574 (+),score=132.14 TRINITY_DN3583_c0_g1_i1:63-1784(+)